ncbi:AlpA family phage regulatory protein [Aquicoccus sp. SU-CL01552]|uniref:helix-turn-helix transcriptional regulator n=1 Tax=Aquicoccus sp. SU-CL01552 TaxID=3127656 RepID=UPI003109EAA6
MKYLSIHQVCEKLGGRSANSIYTDIGRGQLPKPIKLGNRNVWPETAIDEAMADLAKEQGVALFA